MPAPPNSGVPTRDELALRYLEQLPYTPYPVQEQALFAWFSSPEGVLVCAPTGTGKTLIAEAAAYEALHTGSTIYYTTPLIALTEQKFAELQSAAVRWGFHPDDVGLVTGNRRVNPDAKVLVVVAEILLNRLLQAEQFDFDKVSAVVMDEFHSFSDLERGIVWEFSLSLLPRHVRLLLLSATVGNAVPFLSWLRNAHERTIELVQSTDRKVPLSFQWVGDKLLNEHLEEMAAGDVDARRTPALVFCFNRDECWNVAEELKGKAMLSDGQQDRLLDEVEQYDWSRGAGPKLKRILMRGVGVHHAGLLPRYRRIVEDLFQKKLLSVCVCTETLAAGINLPARSVVMPSLMKGAFGKQRIIDASTAHQIFGRAGRPQFDKQGYVYALAHEDDVRIHRWRLQYDQIPEDTKDPNLIKAKKALKKKMPVRSPTRQYWSEQQFEKLRAAPARDLSSQGALPWRMLTYMLQLSPDVDRLSQLVRKRLMEPKRLEQGEKHLHHMLRTLHAAGVVRLEPEPPPSPLDETRARRTAAASPAAADSTSATGESDAVDVPGSPVESRKTDSRDGGAEKLSTSSAAPSRPTAMQQLLVAALQAERARSGAAPLQIAMPEPEVAAAPEYRAIKAYPTERLNDFFNFRSVNPVYAMFLLDLFGKAEPIERLQALESVLELPKSLLKFVRVPHPDRLPPGSLARDFLDDELVARGVISADDLYPPFEPDLPPDQRRYPPPLAEKIRMLFDSEYPNVHGVAIQPVWAAAELLEHGGDFQQYVSSRDLAKQEGLIFRHLLRLVLLLNEFSQVAPAGMELSVWQAELNDWSERFTASCREVDPTSTDYMLAHAGDLDILPRAGAAALAGRATARAGSPFSDQKVAEEKLVERDASGAPTSVWRTAAAPDDFGAGIFDSE